MQKFVAFPGLFCAGLFLSASPILAGSFSTPPNLTTAQTLSDGQTGTIASGSDLKYTSGTDNTAITISGSSASGSQIVITNSGFISTGKASTNGRAIQDKSGGSNTLITNNANALIQSAGDDTIAVNANKTSGITDSVIDIENKGTIQSLDGGGTGSSTVPTATGSQAINLTATTGSNIVNNFSTGVIWATAADAIRPGLNGVIHNDGLIFSNAYQGSGSDGIDAQSNSGITIVNGYTTTTPSSHIATYQGAITGYAGNLTGYGTSSTDVSGKQQSTIEGGRHGITGGNTGTVGGTVQLGGYTGTGAYAMTVVNNQGAIIQGDDGSGINIDGFGIQGPGSTLITNESVSVTNYGTITGDGLSRDGDGIDVDGDVTIDNFGSVISKNAVPEAGSPTGTIEFSEGVTVGGGSITNEQGATIEGEVANGNTQAVGRGITLAGIDHDVNDVDFAIQSIYENSSITNSGTIKGDSESGIAVLGTTGGGYTVTITNNSTGTIEGKNTGVSENTSGFGQSKNQAVIELDDTGNTYVINNSGNITQDTTSTGTAIAMHGTSNTLNITGGTITGDISGDTASDSTMNITPGTGKSFSYGYKISSFTVNVNSDGSNGTVTLTGANTYSGPTTISGGILYANTTGSGNSSTGTGSVTVQSGGTLGGAGLIAPTGTTAGSGVTISSGGTLYSGAAQVSDATHTVVTGGAGPGGVGGLTLNSAGSSSLLTVNGGATLTFALGSNTTGGTFASPNMSSTYLTVNNPTSDLILGNTATPDTIKIVDLTALEATGPSLQLRLQSPYLLIATDPSGPNLDVDFANLLTSGGLGQDGYVESISNGTGGYTAFNYKVYDNNGDLLSSNDYPNLRLYLYQGDLELVPEPGTWALLLGGLALLIFIQTRRRRA